MKKLITIAMILLFAGAKAQVVLEHSYSTNWPMEVVNIEGDGYKYLGIDTTTKAIKIYNTDHSLWKTINTGIPQNATVFSVNSFASKYLFNADNKIEMLVNYYVVSPSTVYTAELYNEDGTILNTFNNVSLYNIGEVNGNWKLLVRSSAFPPHTDVYSLPGSWTGVSVAGKTLMQNRIFPNPVEASATITYSLPEGTNNGTINIYNEGGVLLRSYPVTNQFDDLLISSEELPAGVYVYDITTAKGRVAGQKFVVR